MLFFEIWKPMFIFHSVKTFSPATKNSPPYRQASIATFREGQTSIEWNPISFFRTYQGVYSCSGNNDRGRSNPRNTIRLLIFPPFFSDTWWTGVRRKNKHTHCEQVCWRKKKRNNRKKANKRFAIILGFQTTEHAALHGPSICVWVLSATVSANATSL